ncbi:hypothetical protein PR202_gb22314 [Eleusine coracana subsp. coracana]|uniref:No apical meristem-associated C-terminal domain-containing protein n=1 Tax=Eleusine coracana subsp. coracana TaxID=191504 RepID=A0AAV5FFN6_ELECO|nr:hypothetical protein PR202_gb22314 [Eleusine coracana subsp. coracana]
MEDDPAPSLPRPRPPAQALVGPAPKPKPPRLGLPRPPPPIVVPGAEQGRAAARANGAAGASQARKRPPVTPRQSRGSGSRLVLSRPPASGPGAPAATPGTPAATRDTPEAIGGADAQELFDEMPASIDDETFLNMMDAENFGVDLNTAFDGYDDGMNNFVDNDGFASDGDCDIDGDVPKKKGSRGCNFTVGEDETVVKAWQAVGLDPITGVEQAGATYWNRIYDQFCRNNNSGIFRSQSSVTHRWQTIQVSCTKWAACLEQVHRLNPSGANAEDKVNIAQRLYKGKPKKKGGKSGKAFALHHCWVLLEHDEKWRTRNLEMPTKSKKSSNFLPLYLNDDHEDIGL